MRMLVALFLSLTFVAVVSSESSAQPGSVAQLFAFKVPPGQAGAFLGTVAKIRGVVQRHAPENHVTVYSAMVSGNPGTMVVVSEYPSAEAWGAAGPKITGDPAMRTLGEELAEHGAEMIATVLQRNVTPSGGASSQRTQAGSVAMVFSADVPPGQQGAALDVLARVRTVVQRHAPDNRLSVWASMVAGAATNRMTIVSEYPSAEGWGAAAPTIVGDAEYQRLGQELTALGVEVLSISLMSNVTPQ